MPLSRRRFLQAVGVSLALPWLEARVGRLLSLSFGEGFSSRYNEGESRSAHDYHY